MSVEQNDVKISTEISFTTTNYSKKDVTIILGKIASKLYNVIIRYYVLA
jgi:hypothetical protein